MDFMKFWFLIKALRNPCNGLTT